MTRSDAAPFIAVALGIAIGHGSVFTIRAIDSHLSYQGCIAEQRAALFTEKQARHICADRLN